MCCNGAHPRRTGMQETRVWTNLRWNWRSNTRWKTGHLICLGRFRKRKLIPALHHNKIAGWSIRKQGCKFQILDRSKLGVLVSVLVRKCGDGLKLERRIAQPAPR